MTLGLVALPEKNECWAHIFVEAAHLEFITAIKKTKHTNIQYGKVKVNQLFASVTPRQHNNYHVVESQCERDEFKRELSDLTF